MADAIEFKTSQLSLTLVRVHQNDMQAVAQLLETKLAKASKFLRGAPVVVDPLCDLNSVQMAQLLEYLRQHQLTPVGVRTREQHLIDYAEMCGLAVFKPSNHTAGAEATVAATVDTAKVNAAEATSSATQTTVSAQTEHNDASSKAVGVHKAKRIASLRSGQCEQHLNEDVILEGNLNSGAELFVGGNLTVLGALRGRVHAGAGGDRDCRIIARQLNPELISIAGVFLLADDIPQLAKQGWVEVYLDNTSLKFNVLD